MVRDFRAVGFLLVALFSLASSLFEPAPPFGNHGSWFGGLRLPSVRFVAPTSALGDGSISPPAPVPRPVVAAPQRWVPAPMTWDSEPRTLPGIADRVREDIGFDVSPGEFQGGALSGPLWDWMGASRLTFFSWFRGSVHTASTPLGYDVDLHLFFRWDAWKLAVVLWNQNDGGWSYPGLNLELFELPVPVGPRPLLVTPRLSVWSQPATADTGGRNWGGLGSLTVEVPLDDTVWVWLESRAKSVGWAVGANDLRPQLSVRAGLHWLL